MCRSIGKSCFENCKKFKSIEFSNSITYWKLGISVFVSSGLESFCLDTNKSINEIEKCKKLTSVSLPYYSQFEKIFKGIFEY